MLTYAQFRDAIESKLRDSGNTYFSTAELDDDITQTFRDIAQYVKHLVKITYEVESREGGASSASTGKLVDADNDQFLAGDAGKKIVHNTTDNTWADITAYTDETTVTLSHDIMASGEEYEIFNKGCWKSNQINIEDVEDYMWVDRVEYPIGVRRNFSVNGNILTIDIDFKPDDTSEDDANKLVYVWFALRHKLSQLTTLTGAVNLSAGYDKGDISMVLDGLQSSGTIEEDQEFTLANRSQIYIVTAAATISSNAATISFFPGLDGDVANDVVVTFALSTLRRKEEQMAIEYCVGLALMNEANLHLPQISVTGPSTYKTYLEVSSFRYNNALRQLQSLAKPAVSVGHRAAPHGDYTGDEIGDEGD